MPIMRIINPHNRLIPRRNVHGYDVVIIDEAQRIPGVGLGLKMLIDAESSCRLVVTGSASLGLAGQVGEPLTGRKRTLLLFPIAQPELEKMQNRSELRERQSEYLILGSYPEVVTAPRRSDKIELLDEITGSYLLKDILDHRNVFFWRTWEKQEIDYIEERDGALHKCGAKDMERNLSNGNLSGRQPGE